MDIFCLGSGGKGRAQIYYHCGESNTGADGGDTKCGALRHDVIIPIDLCLSSSFLTLTVTL